MSYKVHHLNCATLCMSGGRLLSGKGSLFQKALMPCHCLLIETDDGLVLIDTGFGYQDITSPTFPDTYLAKYFLGASLNIEECALTQIKKMGFSASDVRHIVLTHMDPDHAGGLIDFPQAKVHILAKELQAATQPITLWEKARYMQHMWKHGPDWQTHVVQGESWYGFESVQVLSDKLFDILLIPLFGHTRGHCGVAVSTKDGWILHCGDAYFHRSEINRESKTPSGLFWLQSLDDVSRAERLYNQSRLRELNKNYGDEIKLIASHDHDEFDCCKGVIHQLGKCEIKQPEICY